jgi:hypothetical protein
LHQMNLPKQHLVRVDFEGVPIFHH